MNFVGKAVKMSGQAGKKVPPAYIYLIGSVKSVIYLRIVIFARWWLRPCSTQDAGYH